MDFPTRRKFRAIALAALAALTAASYSGCSAYLHRNDSEAFLQGANESGVQGLLYLSGEKSGVRIEGNISGLLPGRYALYLNTSGQCGKPVGAKNQFMVKPIEKDISLPKGLGGPLIVFSTDANGVARLNFTTEEISIEPGEKPVVGKSLVVHELTSGRDVGKTSHLETPIGQRVACGVVVP